VSVSGPGGSVSNNNYANTSMVPPVQLTTPTFGMALTTAACPGSTYTLTAATVANATQYAWSSSTGVSFSATSGQTVTCSVPAGSHSITLTVYGGPGYCPNSVTNPLNQAPVLPAHAPTGTAASATQVNPGTTINLTVGNSPPAGATLEWTHQLELSPGVLGQATSSGSSPTVTGAEGSRHHYTPYFANSCGRVAGPPVVVTIICPSSIAAPVITQPVANAQGQVAPVLPLTSIGLSASNPSGRGVVKWAGPGGWTAVGNSASYPVALNQGGQSLTFTAWVELSSCNLSSSPVSVSVPVINCPQHTPTITGPAQVSCPTSTVTLTAGLAPDGYAYAWSTGATTQEITFPVGGTVGLSYRRISDGCPTATAYHTVGVLPDPSVPAPVLSLATDCNTPGVSQHRLAVQSPSAAYTYHWYAGNGQSGALPVGNSYAFEVTNDTQQPVNVNVYARRTDNGCTGTITSQVLYPCLPNAQFSVAVEVDHNACGAAQLQSRASLRVRNAQGRSFTFAWSPANPGTQVSLTPTSEVRERLPNGRYAVTVAVVGGGVAPQTVVFNIGSEPELTATAGGWSVSSFRSEDRNDWASLVPQDVPNPQATAQEYAVGFTASPNPAGPLPGALLYGFWVVDNRVKVVVNGAVACEQDLVPDQRLMMYRDAAANQIKFVAGDTPLCSAPSNPSTPLYLAARTLRGQLPPVGASFCVPRDRRDVCAEPGINYVRTWTPYLRVADLARVLALDTKTQASVQTTYFDGLGRPIQALGHYASPGGNDVVQPMAYDALGRQPRQFLPYTVAPGTCSQYRPLALKDAGGNYQNSEQFKFYQAATGPAGVVRDANPYADTHFEASPLDRPLRQGAPGAAWQVAGAWQPGGPPAPTDRTVKSWGRPNLATDRVRRLALANLWPDNLANATFTSPANGFYAEGQLWVAITQDEHQREVREFKDKGGRTLLKRVETGGATWADTY
jgi:hypothetical protein